MTPDALIERVERAKTAASARAWLRPYAGTEGLSRAYFQRIVTLMGQDPTAGRALADRWPIFAELGDDPAIAYRAKGAAERLRGQWENSIASFQEAGRRARTRQDALAYRVGEVESLGRVGRTEEALALARKLIRGLIAQGQPGLAARVRLNAAAALLWRDDYRRARTWLERAVPELAASRLESELAGAQMSLSTCLLHSGRPEQAMELAMSAAAAYRRLGFHHMANLCESNVAQGQLQSGRADAALLLLLRLREDFASSPADRARCEEFLGDAYLRLNMPEEARHAYESARSAPAMRSLPINAANCDLGLAWAASAANDPALALSAAGRASRAYARFGNPVWEAVADLARADAYVRRGRFQSASELAAPALAQLEVHDARFAQAEGNLLMAQIALGTGHDPRPSLARAARLIHRRGQIGMEWRLHDLTAQSKTGRSRLPHYRKMARAVIEARTLVASDVAKASFLNDKSEALGRYLHLLLSSRRPEAVAEALDVIRASRAAALLDEALAAWGEELAPGVQAQLEELRAEFASRLDPEIPGESTRLGRDSRFSRHAARKWLELTWKLVDTSPAAPAALANRPPGIVFVKAGNRFHAIAEGRAHDLGPAAEIERRLRWLRFELLAPLADPRIAPQGADDLISEFRSRFGRLLDRPESWAILSPDSELWSLPWPAITQLGGSDVEPILCPRPDFGGDPSQWRLPPRPRVVIWGAPRPQLPQIEREIAEAKRCFPEAPVLSTAAEVLDFLRGGKCNLLHVACHARHDPAKPMFSYLDFPGGPIYAIDIARSGLRVDHVTLSACDTGSLSLMNRFEPQGLVRAFLARGAFSTLASLWPLDDESAAIFASSYYRQLCVEENIVNALHRARIDLRERRPHPYFWSSMALFGGYRT